MAQKSRSISRENHGLSGTFEHRVWKGLRTRCYNKNAKGYKFYGARGVRVCKRWLQFTNFLKDMGKAPTIKHSIDRIDSTGNYEPGNCRWADWRTQCENRRTTVMLSYGGETLTAKAWGERLGVTPSAIRQRLKYMPIDRALTELKIAPRFTDKAYRANKYHNMKYKK